MQRPVCLNKWHSAHFQRPRLQPPAGFQCILGSRAPLLWQGVSPGPVGSRNLHRLLGLLCAQLTASGCAGDRVGQSLAGASRKGLPGGRGWDSFPEEALASSQAVGNSLRQGYGHCGPGPSWPSLECLRPIKGPVQEGNPMSSAYAWGEGLWVSSFFFFRVTGFFH